MVYRDALAAAHERIVALEATKLRGADCVGLAIRIWLASLFALAVPVVAFSVWIIVS